MEIAYSTFEMCIVNDYCFQCGLLNTLVQVPHNTDFLIKSCSMCDTTYSIYLKHDISICSTISVSDGFKIPNEETLRLIKSKFN